MHVAQVSDITDHELFLLPESFLAEEHHCCLEDEAHCMEFESLFYFTKEI